MEYSDFARRPFQRIGISRSAVQNADEKNYSKGPQVTIVESRADNEPATTTTTSAKASRYLNHLPWASFIELILVLNTIIGAALLVALIDGHKEWPTHIKIGGSNMPLITPQVVLALVHSIIAFLVGLAVKDGITVAWWRNTLSGPRTVREIDRNYQFGTSLKSAALSGKHLNVIALATIGAAIAALAQGPLMQRALTIYLSHETSTVDISSRINLEIPSGYTGVDGMHTSYGRSYSYFFTSEFNQVVADYVRKSPLLPNVQGCNGTCKTSVRAIGFAPNCDAGKVEDWKYYLNLPKTGYIQEPTKVFSVGFEEHSLLVTDPYKFWEKQPTGLPYKWPWITMKSQYVQSPGLTSSTPSPSINGSITTRHCSLHPAIIEYPLVIVNVSTQPLDIHLDNAVNPLDYRIVSPVKLTYSEAIPHLSYARHHMTLGGLVLAMNLMYGSTARVSLDGIFGWTIQAEKASDMNYMHFAGENTRKFIEDGTVDMTDPTEDMLKNLHSLTFRTAIQATNASTPVNIQSAQQIRPINRYNANFAYLTASVAVTIVGVILIVPAFWGWWELGRKVSLNPIEIAEAFNAPILRNDEAHSNTDELLNIVGDRKVVYTPRNAADQQTHDASGVKRVWKMELVDARTMENSEHYDARYVR